MSRPYYVFKRILIIANLFAALSWLHAQAVPTASRAGIAQFGAGWSVAAPDYGPSHIQGLTLYGTYDFTRHWGIEGDIHHISSVTPSDVGEDSYLLGPRFVLPYGRFRPYTKALLGLARFKYANLGATYTYKVYSFGGGLDIFASRHINVRAVDFEFQQWPGFPPNGLSPMVWSFGAAYSFR